MVGQLDISVARLKTSMKFIKNGKHSFLLALFPIYQSGLSTLHSLAGDALSQASITVQKPLKILIILSNSSTFLLPCTDSITWVWYIGRERIFAKRGCQSSQT